jgi:hypothetical protein
MVPRCCQNYFIKDLTNVDAPASGSDLGELGGMQPALYHRYNVVDEGDDDDDDDDDDDEDEEEGEAHTSVHICTHTQHLHP